MSELLPTRQAATLQTALLDYLTTTFALADTDVRGALTAFLEHQRDGIFKGPYVRTRLPFASAPGQPVSGQSVSGQSVSGQSVSGQPVSGQPVSGQSVSGQSVSGPPDTGLDVLPAGFVPYGHQSAAFARLSSRDRRPLPTLVTTGTGSGKTECFLLPILDHVLRARRRGVTGTKALILYPMNALANDQASRLAGLITDTPAPGATNPYAGVTAALYTGEGGPERTTVSPAGLITSRAIIRSQAPDILLTNYKMLDHLLLRSEDAGLWEQSADSLQYVVLDEFHTYDGAQGTDVAMLLRRLGLTLKHYWPARGTASDTHEDADWVRPLGRITPVGTSATLGDGGDPTAMVGFASEIFGERFDGSCVVTESRMSLDEWFADAATPPGLEPAGITSTLVDRVVADLDDEPDGDALCRRLLAHLLAPAGVHDDPEPFARVAPPDLLRSLKALPLVRSVVEHTRDATNLDDLVAAVLPADARGSRPDTASAFVALVVAALSHLRAVMGRGVVSGEVHLWIRELTRIDRRATSAASFSWSDDGRLALPLSDETGDPSQPAFPAVYCRHCGRSGWGVELATTGLQLSASDDTIRSNHLAKTGRFRALIHAPSEGQRASDGTPVDGLMWFHTDTRELGAHLPDADDPAFRDGRILPTLLLTGPDADDHSRNDRCPSCLQRDGIRFLGSAIATLLSVSLSTLFGAADLDPAEKKALVFTDSVQDAAHRAGFVAARSHTLTMRSVMRDAFADVPGELSLPEIAREVLRRAGDDPFRRYRILPAEFVGDQDMHPFFRLDRQSLVPRNLREKVERRLRFDLAMEFGLNSQLGRTLEATGSVGVQVNLGSPSRMAAIARSVISGEGAQTLDGGELHLGDTALTRWVRGVVEHMRTQGAVEHEWFERYIKQDGNRWAIWGGRPASQGMPAFPRGRSAPGFPQVGGHRPRDPLLDSVTDTQSWYARWTGRALGVSPQHGARLARGLLDRLARDLLIKAVTTDSGGTVYTLPASGILVAATDDADLDGRRHRLLCDTCHTQVTGSVEVVDQLDGAPCVYVRCPGRLTRAAMAPDNFYRRLYASSDMRRIVAREHTSLLDSRKRLEYEEGFKRGQSDPDSPNTLVATPTLEMGIDIGDLSAVFLASLPRTVASYLQRVGRAGRRTGNALNLTYVTGRGQLLPQLDNPGSLINGAVRPPSIHLSAEEILQRQYLAHLVDAFARDGLDNHHPRTARMAMEHSTPGSFLGDLIDEAEARPAEGLDRFVATFGENLTQAAIEHLQAWATPVDGPHTSGLAQHVYQASQRWAASRELLMHRQHAIEQALPGLQESASVPAASEDDKRALQTARAALKLVQRRLGDLTGEYWISTLEEFGLLPNYTLLGDSATLDVSISWYDPEKGSYEWEPENVQRPTAQALREFAPGATFYAKGLEITVDAVDLGSDADDIRDFAFCPDCGYAVDTTETGVQQLPPGCPRCGATGLRDTGQRVPVVELKRASAAIRRDEALIDDRHDERQNTPFTIIAAADIDPDAVTRQWYVDGYDFGAKYLRRVTIRWLNVGRRATTASPLTVAGATVPASRFRVCESCGHLDTSAKTNSMDEHRPWCEHRRSTDEHVRTIGLSRTLTTQGVVLPLPWSVTAGDSFALPSLQAALMLGLRDQFGGSPDHIGVGVVRDPNPGGTNPEALLLHDTVPGGTGYLADLADPTSLWQLLHRAYEVVRDCACRDEDRLACHRCLLPFAAPHEVDKVSRQSAERHLRAILAAGHPDTDEPGSSMGWTITSVATRPPTGESHLELRFRQAFLALVGNLGATVKEQPGAWGNSIAVSLGHAHWLLHPQLQVQGVRPDFVLTSAAGSPDVAVFLDGYAFHATPAHNRIADDAVKRATLRLQGYEVLAITSQDLDEFEAGTARPRPAWFKETYLQGLIGLYGFSHHVADAALGGPMATLAEWMQQHQREDFERFARAVPVALPHTVDLTVPERATLSEIARALFDGTDEASGGTGNAWWWRQGALGVLARRRTGEGAVAASGAVAVDVAVVIDDQSTSLGTPQFRGDWETWLELSNLLMFRSAGLRTDITTLSADDLAATRTRAEAPRRAVTAQWREALGGLLLGDLIRGDAEALADALSTRGVPAPDSVGVEIGDEGIPVDFAWSDRRVAVLLDPDDDDAHDLESAGWRLVPADADAISAALEDRHA